MPHRLLVSDDTVTAIRWAYRETTWSQAEIAELFGVTQGWVSRVVRGRTRTDAGGPICPSRYKRRSPA